MSGPVTRNSVVQIMGTPQRVEGSLNDPVEREELGLIYNEKWTYLDLRDDPAGVAQRAIYWHRYDFVATLVRADDDAQWQPDSKLIEAAEASSGRLPPIDDHHPPYPENGRYHPVSRVRDSHDLGGYIQDEATGRYIGEEKS